MFRLLRTIILVMFAFVAGMLFEGQGAAGYGSRVSASDRS